MGEDSVRLLAEASSLVPGHGRGLRASIQPLSRALPWDFREPNLLNQGIFIGEVCGHGYVAHSIGQFTGDVALDDGTEG